MMTTIKSALEQCMCCGCFTIASPAFELGSTGDRCPVCAWVSDFAQEHDRQLRSGRNPVSLSQAEEAYRETGAVHPALRNLVRSPRPDELEPRGRSPR